MYGRAVGNVTLLKICHAEAPNDCIIRSGPSSTDLKPAIPFTKSGKNVARITRANFELKPNPNHTMSSGASAILGMLWSATTNGRSRYSTSAKRTLIVARPSPAAEPTT